MKKRNENEAKLWKTAAWDMLYLLQCSINADIPESERVTKMDFCKVYALSCRQSLEAMTYMALERLMKVNDVVRNYDPEQILIKWEESKNKVIRKTLLMDAAREQLFAYLEEQKIWHLPLKGVVLCLMYPEFGMRQMADNDILFDASFRQDVRDWFVAHGYTVKSFDESNHDEYHKEPIYNFEMHTALFHESAQPQFSLYYLSLKSRLYTIAGKTFEYGMTDEDFYIYILAHEYKHYSSIGTGLRSLLDLYVYNKAKDNLDRKYLDEELAKIGLYDFERDMKELSLKVFAPEFDYSILTEKEQKMLYELLFSRTYGTMENFWRKQVKKTQSDGIRILAVIKIKYLLRRVFPRKADIEKWCELYVPFFSGKRWMIPIAYIWRIVRVDKKRRKMIKKELDTVRKM